MHDDAGGFRHDEERVVLEEDLQVTRLGGEGRGNGWRDRHLQTVSEAKLRRRLRPNSVEKDGACVDQCGEARSRQIGKAFGQCLVQAEADKRLIYIEEPFLLGEFRRFRACAWQ